MIESDKEGEDLIHNSLQKKWSLKKNPNDELFENNDNNIFNNNKKEKYIAHQHISDLENDDEVELSDERDSNENN